MPPMGQGLETLKTLNSITRTGLTIVIVGGIAGGGWWGYRTIDSGKRNARDQAAALEQAHRDLEDRTLALAARDRLVAEQTRELDRLGTDLQESKLRVDQLSTAMQLLKVDQRLARLTVIDQGPDPETGRLSTTVEWVELNEAGRPLDEPRVFTISGDVVYVDNWVVKFDEAYIEAADELRSTTLVLFRRIFGEHQQPTDGYVLDRVGPLGRPVIAGKILDHKHGNTQSVGRRSRGFLHVLFRHVFGGTTH